MPDADVEFYVWSELNWLHTVTTYIQVNPLWKQVGGSKYVRFSLTRSYAALRAADLTGSLGQDTVWAGKFWRKTMKNYPGTMKNHKKHEKT